jgi:hypothetical protein
MALQPWVSNIFKPLDMTGIQGYPHDLPKDVDRWLPKFSNNNDTSTEDHLSLFYQTLGSMNPT